jgi:hypothetical protein
MQDVMIDLETLGTSPRSCFVTAGAIRFCSKTGAVAPIEEGLYYRIEWDLRRRSVDPDTLQWWMSQGEAAQKALTDPNVPLVSIGEFLTHLSRFIKPIDETKRKPQL